MATVSPKRKKKEEASHTKGSIVIFITNRRAFGGEIRMVPQPRFKKARTTGKLHRAAMSENEGDAEQFLKRFNRLPRYCYTVGKV